MTGLIELAYTPFLDPIHALYQWWYLLIIPLGFGISVIWKAIRLPDLSVFWKQVGIMTVQIVVAMIALAACLILLVQVVIPMMPVR